MSEWIKVIFASEIDCTPCEMCEEPVCRICKIHYADCSCPGPCQDDLYEYRLINGVEMAKLLEKDIGNG